MSGKTLTFSLLKRFFVFYEHEGSNINDCAKNFNIKLNYLYII